MQKLVVLILTDSLSLPRALNDSVVTYNETYINLLKEANPTINFIHVGIGGATITQLNQLVKYYRHSNPDYVILHCGIVDCTPRSLSEFELTLLGKMRILRLTFPFKNILRKYRKLTYTNIQLFSKTLGEIKDAFKDVPLITIGILPASPDFEHIAPGITKNVQQYNEVLRNNSIYIDNTDFPYDGIIEDHHHLNAKGHMVLFNKLQKLINKGLGTLNS